ncbi:MAG: response regulator transcription factor [Ginsengibacter sp.]
MKFLLVDDHTIIRTGLKMLITNFIAHSVIEEAFDGDSAFEKLKNSDYDMVVLDVNLPNTDSFSLVTNILTIKPAVKILVFSMNAEDNYAKRYLKLGARGYIRKDESETEIKKAISTVLNNKRYLSESLSHRLEEDAFGNKVSNNPFERLSPREFEIIQHIVRGESVSQISEKLKLHTSTIGTHKARIFEKLSCKNIIDINALAKTFNVVSA